MAEPISRAENFIDSAWFKILQSIVNVVLLPLLMFGFIGLMNQLQKIDNFMSDYKTQAAIITQNVAGIKIGLDRNTDSITTIRIQNAEQARDIARLDARINEYDGRRDRQRGLNAP